MENKINIAELLKNCPQGMELDCAKFENVILDEVSFDKDPNYPIRIVTKSGTMLSLSKYGTYIEDTDSKCVIFPKGKTTWEGFVPPCEFKVGDKIKDTRNNSEGIIEKIDEENCTCLFDYGRFYFPITELDNFELVPNKSDITSKQSYMEEINVDWCKQHGMTLSQVNVARDTSYYLETNGFIILVYTTSTTGDQKLHVINPDTKKEIEFSLSRLNRDLNKLNSITTDDLRKLCELVNLDYPFKS